MSRPTDKVTIPEVLGRFVAYYKKPENKAWGPLHLVLEDGNIEDRHVNYCLEEAKKAGDEEGAFLARTLLKMTKSQRSRLPGAVREAI